MNNFTQLKKIMAIVLSCFCSVTFAADNWQLKMQDFLTNWRIAHHVPAAVVSIETSDGKITTFLSGTTQLQGATPVQPDNLFGVGSISKTFVAVIILQLQQEGKLNLSNKIGQYFPEYPRWKNITIKQLLNMTSGIPNHTTTAEYKKLLTTKPQTDFPLQKFTDLAYAQPDKFSPGTKWYYSNTNYYLLGMLIPRVTGHSFADELQNRVLTPLKLNHTFYSNKTYQAIVQVQQVHSYQDDLDVTYDSPSYYGPAGSMLMTSVDLVRWTEALFTPGKILSSQALAEMMTTIPTLSVSPKLKGARFGLGIYSLDIPNVGIVWCYTGIIRGYSSIMMWIPSRHLIITAQIDRLFSDNRSVLMPNQEFMKQLLKILNK